MATTLTSLDLKAVLQRAAADKAAVEKELQQAKKRGGNAFKFVKPIALPGTRND